ncbi:hypothetical protein DI44_01220 [Geobacillus sp. CAMR5420]|nr:hypothetical protein DI44_01220 [Geobacillus sp. CAMR5420]
MLIRKNPTGKYFVSVWVETDIQLLPTVDRRVGIDLGQKHFAVLSKSEAAPNAMASTDWKTKKMKMAAIHV